MIQVPEHLKWWGYGLMKVSSFQIWTKKVYQQKNLRVIHQEMDTSMGVRVTILHQQHPDNSFDF